MESPEIDEEEEVEEEEVEKVPKISRRKLYVILVVAVVVGAVGGYAIFFTNQAPVATFTYSAVDKKLSVSGDASHDPDGRITSYQWDWGDGITGTGIRTAHTYASEGTYTVKLTIRDDRNAEGTRSESIQMVVRPTADFDVDVDRMSISVDGSLSSSASGGAITNWAWEFGDGETAAGERATHTYTTPGRYAVKLTVTDASNRVGNVSRYVSPADTTVDVKISGAHTAGCPYETYWDWRYDTYGDVILYDSAPCINQYPWVLFTATGEINPSFLYTNYHRVSTVRNHPGYTTMEPVILPVNNSVILPDPTSYINFNFSVEYMGEEWARVLNNTPYAPLPGLLQDGFESLIRGNITMDLTMTKRIFGVVASNAVEAQAWWYAHTGPPRQAGDAENFTAKYIDVQGNGKYNIYSGFEWELVVDLIVLNATVAPDGTTRIQIWWEIYGMDALWMRWWYWGKASYADSVNGPFGQFQPVGWAPEELCWCEHATMVGNITDHLDLDYSADAAYQWLSWANKGSDNTWGTPDDLPAWVWEPIYLDYVPGGDSGSPGAGKYDESSLDWWNGKTMVHASPGSYNYGDPYEYMLAATRYIFKSGYTLTIRMPQGNVPWFDPVQSSWDPVKKLGNYVFTSAPITLRFVEPDNSEFGEYYLWDSRAKVLSFAGPYDYGGRTGLPLLPEPWVEMQPEAVE